MNCFFFCGRHFEESGNSLQGGVPACSFLRVGQSFSGSQRVFRATSKDEDWGVTVRIEELDLARGFVCGSMCASNVPAAATPIVTHWEGCEAPHLH